MATEAMLRVCCCLSGYYYNDNYDELTESVKNEKTNLNDQPEGDYSATVIEKNISNVSELEIEEEQKVSSEDLVPLFTEHVPGCPESPEFKELLANRVAAAKPNLNEEISAQRNSWRAASFAMNVAANTNRRRDSLNMNLKRSDISDSNIAKKETSASEDSNYDNSSSNPPSTEDEDESIPSDISEIDSSEASLSVDSEFDIESPDEDLSVDTQNQAHVEVKITSSDKAQAGLSGEEDLEDSTASCYSLSSPVTSDGGNHSNQEEVYNLQDVSEIRNTVSQVLPSRKTKSIDPSRYPKIPTESDSTSIATEDLSDMSTDDYVSVEGGSSSSKSSAVRSGETSGYEVADIYHSSSSSLAITAVNSKKMLDSCEDPAFGRLGLFHSPSDFDGESRSSSRIGTEISSTVADSATLVGSSLAPSRSESWRDTDEDCIQEMDKGKKKKGLVSKIKKRVLR